MTVGRYASKRGAAGPAPFQHKQDRPVLVYVLRRIVYVILIVVSVALVCFLLVHITPGDPLVAVLPPDASAELAAQLRAAYGFDQPLPVQFGLWVWHALHGNLGTSIATGRPVLAEVTAAVGNTFILAVSAAIIGFALGAFFGLIAGYFRNTWVDKLATSIAVAGVSVPPLLAGHGAGHHLLGVAQLAAPPWAWGRADGRGTGSTCASSSCPPSPCR